MVKDLLAFAMLGLAKLRLAMLGLAMLGVAMLEVAMLGFAMLHPDLPNSERGPCAVDTTCFQPHQTLQPSFCSA